MSEPDRIAARNSHRLLAVCEGCGREEMMIATNPRQIYAPQPEGWIGYGRSRYRLAGHADRTALWCPTCAADRTKVSNMNEPDRIAALGLSAVALKDIPMLLDRIIVLEDRLAAVEGERDEFVKSHNEAERRFVAAHEDWVKSESELEVAKRERGEALAQLQEPYPLAWDGGRLMLNAYGRRCYDKGREQAEAALLALQRHVGQEWQPIETAPKDGSWFWVKRDSQTGPQVSAFAWDESHDMWFAGTGWWQDFPMRFTHWMPMPNPPAALLPSLAEKDKP